MPGKNGKPSSAGGALSSALRSLSYGDRTSSDLRARLLVKGYSREHAGEAIARLREEGLLDDERTARRRVSYLVERKHFGPSRIRADLTAKGVPPSDASRYIAEETEGVDFREVALCYALSKRIARPEDEKSLRRAVASLARAGFTSPQIRYALENL